MTQENKNKRVSDHQYPVRKPGLLCHFLLFIFIGFAALFPTEISAQVILGSPTTYTNDGKVMTFKHTVEDGKDRLLVVGIGFEDGDEHVISVKYGGNNLTFIADRSAKNNDDDPHVSAWYLIDPPVGSHTVQVVFSDDGEAGAGAISFTGVDQGNPIGNITVASAETGAPNITVSSFAGAIVMDVIAHAEDVEDGPIPGNAQTQLWRLGLDGDGPTTGASIREGKDGDVNMTWHGASGEWAAIGFNIRPAEFTIDPPAIPTLVSPDNNATNVSVTPTLSWNTADRAQTYQVQVSTTPNFGTTVINQSGITTTSYNVATALQNNTQYYWRVRAINIGGESNWSTARTFTTIIARPATPTLVSPANNATDQPTTLTIEWNAAARAETYHVQVALTSAFISPVVNDSGLTVLTRELEDLEAGAQYFWRVNATNTGGTGPWSTVWNFTIIPTETHSISLRAGWNLVSSYIEPLDSTTGSVFKSIADNLIIVKDGTGKIYFPALGVDDIRNWNYSRGYKIYLSPDADELEIFGIQRKPDTTPIQLLAGWNMVGYMRTDQVDAASALKSIENDLIIAKNGSGQVYLPAGVISEHPINTMGTMKPGEGYRLYVTSQTELLYPPYSVFPQQDIAGNADIQQSSEPIIVEPKHYTINGNTGTNAVLIVISEEMLEGDEIGVQTSTGMLIGSGVVQNAGRAAVTIWGDDLHQPESISGAQEGETLTLIHWSVKDRQERNLIVHGVTDIIAGTVSAGEIIFTNDAVIIADVDIEYEIPEYFELYQNYPNPFNPTTTLLYALPKDCRVVLEVYNLLGQRIRTLVDEEHRAGVHEVVFDGSDLSSGTYFYRIHTPDHTAVKKFILLK